MKSLNIEIRNILKDKIKDYNSSILIIRRNWFTIAGQKYCNYCEADKVVFKKNTKLEGILYIKCYNTAISFYIDQYKNNILERTNIIFGYNLIKDIRIIQYPKLIKMTEFSKETKITKEKQNNLNERTKNITNDNLKKTLQELIILTNRDSKI